MDGFWLEVLPDSISVISGGLEGDNERQCATNSRSSPTRKTMVLNQGLLSEAESFFLKGKSIQILIFKMLMVILNFNILRHGPWQMHL